MRSLKLNSEYVVEKSNYLILAELGGYSFNALRLLDVYLSRINARDSNTAAVRFTKREFCSLIGLSPKTKTSDIRKALDCMHDAKVRLPVECGNLVGERTYTLFASTGIFFDRMSRMTVIELECNEKLRPLFFDIAENGYIRYALRNILPLRSKYSMLLYNRLKMEAFRNPVWTVSTGELRKIMCATDATNANFKYFSRTLAACRDEINANTDIRFSYGTVYEGKYVSAIVFDIRDCSDRGALPGTAYGSSSETENAPEGNAESADDAGTPGTRIINGMPYEEIAL